MTDYDHRVIEQWMAANGWEIAQADLVLPWAGPEPAANEWRNRLADGECLYARVPIRSSLNDYQRRLQETVERLASWHGLRSVTPVDQVYERMQRSVEGAVPTDDERMQQIRERTARDNVDSISVGDACFLIHKLDAMTVDRSRYRAAIVAHNAPILDRIELLRDKVNEHRERARVGHTHFDDLECDCEREALAWMRAIDRESERLIRINGEVVK